MAGTVGELQHFSGTVGKQKCLGDLQSLEKYPQSLGILTFLQPQTDLCSKSVTYQPTYHAKSFLELKVLKRGKGEEEKILLKTFTPNSVNRTLLRNVYLLSCFS